MFAYLAGHKGSFWRFCLILIVMSIGFMACGKPAATPALTDQPVASIVPGETPAPPATETTLPTPTAQPPLAILLATPGADSAQVALVQPVLSELAAQDGWRFESRADLPANAIEEGIMLVVVMMPDPGVAELAAQYPEIQFLAAGIPDVPASANLSLISPLGDRPDRQGFLAGYLAAVITQDWRVGVISLPDTPAGMAARQGFLNGVVFYCGLCRPVYPPFYQYPLYAEIPAGADQAEQQAIANTLIESEVETVYVYPEAGDEGLLAFLAQAGVNIIGGITPPDGLSDHWVASVYPDWAAAIRLAWSQLVSGQTGFVLDVPVMLTDRNDALFSPGRQRLVEKTLTELSDGFIDTGVDPQTGAPR
ncbi:MAG: hypothetical protein AB1894_07170 [Chloroflexota bacterium]